MDRIRELPLSPHQSKGPKTANEQRRFSTAALKHGRPIHAFAAAVAMKRLIRAQRPALHVLLASEAHDGSPSRITDSIVSSIVPAPASHSILCPTSSPCRLTPRMRPACHLDIPEALWDFEQAVDR